METSDTKNNFKQLFDDTKQYVKLQTDYLRVQSVEKLTILLSTILIALIILIFAAGALFYLFFTLAYAISPFVGGLAVSFAIITLLYLILIAILYVFRKKWVLNPILNLLMKLFYDKTDENNSQDNKLHTEK